MSDIEIARKANKKPIQEVGARLGIHHLTEQLGRQIEVNAARSPGHRRP